MLDGTENKYTFFCQIPSKLKIYFGRNFIGEQLEVRKKA